MLILIISTWLINAGCNPSPTSTNIEGAEVPQRTTSSAAMESEESEAERNTPEFELTEMISRGNLAYLALWQDFQFDSQVLAYRLDERSNSIRFLVSSGEIGGQILRWDVSAPGSTPEFERDIIPGILSPSWNKIAIPCLNEAIASESLCVMSLDNGLTKLVGEAWHRYTHSQISGDDQSIYAFTFYDENVIDSETNATVGVKVVPVCEIWDITGNKVKKSFPVKSTEFIDFIENENKKEIIILFPPFYTDQEIPASVEIYDPTLGALVQSWELPEIGFSIAIDPQGNTLAVGKSEGSIDIYNLTDMQFSQTMKGKEKAPVLWLDFHPQEKILASVIDGGAIQFADLITYTLLDHSIGIEENIREAGFSHDGKMLFVITDSSKVYLYAVKPNQN